MRDSKKRISLSAIQFEDPRVAPTRKTTTTAEIKEAEDGDDKDNFDSAATVVQRRLVARNEDEAPRRHVANVFDTVRARGVSVNA